LRSQAAEFRRPALVICGKHDLLVPPAVGRELSDTLPDAHWELISNCAHFPPVEQPVATAEAITQFLADTPRRAG
jgi:pimeloyl-ACP methyl ester carboxylesterase